MCSCVRAVLWCVQERMHTIVTQRHLHRSFGPDAVPGPCPILTRFKQRQQPPLEQEQPQQQQGPAAARSDEGGPAQNGHGGSNGRAEAPTAGGGQEAAAASSSQAAAGEPQPPREAAAGPGGTVATATHVQRLKAQWFKEYAYPLTDEVRCSKSIVGLLNARPVGGQGAGACGTDVSPFLGKIAPRVGTLAR